MKYLILILAFALNIFLIEYYQEYYLMILFILFVFCITLYVVAVTIKSYFKQQ